MQAWICSAGVVLALSVTALPGCDAPARSGATAEAAAKGEAAAPADAQPAEAAEPSYTVDVELPDKTTQGTEAIARVRVNPTKPWHMNLEYPAKLRLEPTAGVALDAKLLRKTDAERLDDDALVFSVLFTPKAKGQHTIEAEIDFAVCGDAACGPVTEAVELAFETTCRSGDALC